MGLGTQDLAIVGRDSLVIAVHEVQELEKVGRIDQLELLLQGLAEVDVADVVPPLLHHAWNQNEGKFGDNRKELKQ